MARPSQRSAGSRNRSRRAARPDHHPGGKHFDEHPGPGASLLAGVPPMGVSYSRQHGAGPLAADTRGQGPRGKIGRARTEWAVRGRGPGKPLSPPLPDEVRDQLARILGSPEFVVPERARGFLRYVVEQTLAGHADRLKGYTIATAVFERDESFDAQADPVVRTEAGRLRRALERYYLVAGQADPVVIEVPKGGYVADLLPPRRAGAEVAGCRGTARGGRNNAQVRRARPLACRDGRLGGADGPGGGPRLAAPAPRPATRGHRRDRDSRTAPPCWCCRSPASARGTRLGSTPPA